MREPPDDVADGEVLGAVRDQWSDDVDRVEHLPVGFGAHHWAAYVGDDPRLFVTLDRLGVHHDADSLERAYAGAAALAAGGLEFVVPCLPSRSGTRTVPFGGGALSATEWVDGERPTDASGVLPLVRRLHAADRPAGLPVWAPLVPSTYADDLAARLCDPWSCGPFATEAHTLLAGQMDAIDAWTRSYHRLAEEARQRPWAATHGEPHERNQLAAGTALRLVDWESLRLAPAERDLRWLGVPADDDMLRMFDLEWRLDEIAQYADWFEGPHADTDDDRIALEGLREALARP